MKFYVCEICGNLVEMVKESGAAITCCGQKMKEIVPGTVDAAFEKHVPVVQVIGQQVKVSVGAVTHPMLDVHYIEWIALETKKGVQRKTLSPNQSPEVVFVLTPDDEVVAAYAYCNLHGLWKSE